ncbi:Hpt domain-containing protein [Curvivirga sp.]|uniref:Hpt domain-containing protein n=1 Tax=Curvivirga sp. TaxID=2856848 RepID=UPI003B5B9C86
MAIDEDLLAQLKLDFLDHTTDQLEEIDTTINNQLAGNIPPQDALKIIRRIIHSIKGQAGSFGFPTAGIIAHRLEDFIEDDKKVTPELSISMHAFLDKIREIAESGIEPTSEEATGIMRKLPVKRSTSIQSTAIDFDIQTHEVEVLLVTPSRVSGKIVREELQACGFRVVRVQFALEAFEFAVRSKPDVMIFAMTLDELSGSDLARAFNAMVATSQAPVAVLTSFSLDHPGLQGLPEGISVIRSGATHFPDDMGDFLARIQTECM